MYFLKKFIIKLFKKLCLNFINTRYLIGLWGEILVIIKLFFLGYKIISHRKKYIYEIDIIAVKNKVIHFIEVKTRLGQELNLGNLEKSFSFSQKNRIRLASHYFLKSKKIQHEGISFDLYFCNGIKTWAFFDFF